ncbi:UTP--GlnB (protein PII) uridylyltransferase, GlnD [Streptomyces sp. WMMB 714]|uniref:bifunctional uridylyltransferase/uridylyl-removing protein GlnD n=1 Tax=Streptomyces sp. WMMB 714 TaxID=1286822 RepID=UPI0005F829ED|nr:bifunctional uridylyltransferase/uridylyl-removing protein GlnD [Streptomyces sp. WMMB 714]SCK36540.1 UTP--GlnB (protein PII) uridylyltransferase, GlnD [Streptomyces sp. WMMB 714]
MVEQTETTRAAAAPEAGPAVRPGGYAAARLRLLDGARNAVAGGGDLWPLGGASSGPARREELARITDQWLCGLLGPADPGVALVAVGGYGRGELSPRSDLDLLLLHDGSRAKGEIARLADQIWYPVWDLGIALDHSVRTPSEVRAVAQQDLKAQLGLLDARHVAGDEALTAQLRGEAFARWRAEAHKRLPEAGELADERTRSHGELRFLLEPDLKEARGGLRDATLLRAVAASWLADPPRGGLEEARRVLLDVRDALHLATGRATDRLAQQDQSQVAAAVGLLDSDVLLRQVYEAARTVAYANDVTWREVNRVLRGRAGRSSRLRGMLGGGSRRAADQGRTPLAEGVVEHDGEAVLARTARPERDPVLLLRAAAAAAQAQLPLAPPAVRRLAEASRGASPRGSRPASGLSPGTGGQTSTGATSGASATSGTGATGAQEAATAYDPLPVPWPAEARQQFVSLLGAGEATVPVWEALEAEGLITRLLPDWERVRSRPQRNPVHRFTVDRHLVETAVRASALTRRVQRPDLLLVSALLHDIGKGWPGDHSIVGETIARDTACRMGFAAPDVEVVAMLVRHHLLLVETATRRDLDDPATIRSVADAVGSAGTLELLHALTEADALATGPAAWSSWRSALVTDLVKRVAGVLAGETAEQHTDPYVPTAEAEQLASEAWRSGGPVLTLRSRPEGPAEDRSAAPPAGDREALPEEQEPVGVELLVAVPAPPAPDGPPAPATAPDTSRPYAMGVLPAVAGVLALHRLTVRSADLRVLRLPDAAPGPGGEASVMLLSWRVATEFGSLPLATRLRSDLARALDGSLDIAARLAEREAAYRRPRRVSHAPPPRVSVAPAGSEVATVLEIRAQDAQGLLYRIGRALEGAGVIVRSAHVSTLGSNAVDAFYVTGPDSAPLPAAEAAGLARDLERDLGSGAAAPAGPVRGR